MKKIIIALILTMAMTSAYSKTGSSSSKVAAAVCLPDTFKKIDAKELPPAVVETLLKDYPTSKLSQAFRNHQNKFKLIMVLKSGTRRTVYIDAYGRWVKG